MMPDGMGERGLEPLDAAVETALRDVLSEGRDRGKARRLNLPDGLQLADALLDGDLPTVKYAIEPYFPVGEVTEVSGAHGVFKSTLLLYGALAVATGTKWNGAAVQAGASAFVTMEDSRDTIARRVRAWISAEPDPERREKLREAVRENFAFLAREECQNLALTRVDGRRVKRRGAVVRHLRALLRGRTFAVLETAARLSGGDENNESLAVFARALERIAQPQTADEYGLGVAVVRHVSKEAARKSLVDSYVGRGGGALSDAVRSVVVVVRDRGEEDCAGGADRAVRLHHTKATHSRPGPSLAWKPMPSPEGVVLEPLSPGEDVQNDAAKLLSHIAAFEDGVTRRELLRRRRPAGLNLSNARLDAALTALDIDGRVTRNEEPRGRTKQKATVYRATPGTAFPASSES